MSDVSTEIGNTIAYSNCFSDASNKRVLCIQKKKAEQYNNIINLEFRGYRHYLRNPTFSILIQYWSVTDRQTDTRRRHILH